MVKLKDYIYHEEPMGVIYCGDCREILPLIPEGSVDLVVTDPPYGINYVSNHRTIKYDKIANDLSLIHI